MTLVLGAEESPAADEDSAVIDVPKLGLHYERPEKYENLKGSLMPGGGFPGPGLLRLEWEYYAVAPDRMEDNDAYGEAYLDALEQDEDPPEAPDPSWMNGREQACLFAIFGINGGRGEDELRALLREYNAPFDDNLTTLEKICTDGDTSFYLGQYSRVAERMDEYREVMGDFFPEFEDLYKDKETFLSAFTLRRPMWPAGLEIGDTLSFETTDLDGNPVSSAELFAESKVTMINLWGTWCGPCRNELPELGRLAGEFEAQGVQVIGICNDAFEAENAELAKSLLQDAGAEYLCLVGSEDLDDYFSVTAFPTTFFVDSEGRLLLEPVVGANVDYYPQAMAEALAAVE